MGGLLLAFLLVTGVAGIGPAAPALAAGAPRNPEEAVEYSLKSAFLFNFTKFVDWPADAFPDEKSPFQLCVLGEDPFGGSLDTVVANESVNGRPIAVRRLAHGADPKACQILFLGRAERQPEVLSGLRGSPVLTVGESDRFLAEGGLISFFLEAHRVRFEINLQNVERTRLKISSKLLRLAKVTPEEHR
jgi:hypothetical protein